MVIFQYNLYIFGIHLWTVLYPKPCYNEPCYKEVEVLLWQTFLLSTKNTIITLNKNIKLSPSLLCRRQITLSNTDEICSLAIPNQISLISMHIQSYHLEMKIWACLRQINPSIFDEIWPFAIPNKISTIYQCTYQVWLKSLETCTQVRKQTYGHVLGK